MSVSNLVENTQLCFLPEEQNSGILTGAMDHVNDRFGESTVTWASVLTKEKKQKVIAPGTRNRTLHEYK